MSRLDIRTLFKINSRAKEAIRPPKWGLGTLRIERENLREWLGPPHCVEIDPMWTRGGEVDAWAFLLPSGQRVMMC